MSDRSQPPALCRLGKRPLLTQRKSVDRLIGTTLSTSRTVSRSRAGRRAEGLKGAACGERPTPFVPWFRLDPGVTKKGRLSCIGGTVPSAKLAAGEPRGVTFDERPPLPIWCRTLTHSFSGTRALMMTNLHLYSCCRLEVSQHAIEYA